MLIAINPHKKIDALYSYDVIQKYRGVSITTLPAHVFGIGKRLSKLFKTYLNSTFFKYTSVANELEQGLKTSQKPQSVIISGPSGAGKTETSKLLLNFFCENTSPQLAQHMIQANVLLESFGNSRTTENANSSRFIKIIQVNFFGPFLE